MIIMAFLLVLSNIVRLFSRIYDAMFFHQIKRQSNKIKVTYLESILWFLFDFHDRTVQLFLDFLLYLLDRISMVNHMYKLSIKSYQY